MGVAGWGKVEIQGGKKCVKLEKRCWYGHGRVEDEQSHIFCREEQHVDCDRRLEAEMEGLRARTAVEIDQLKAQTRELYERENRMLSEARDNAVSERDSAKAAEKEANERYESLMME